MESTRPSHDTFLIDLPLCRLNVMHAGHGPALIMVPATISRLENWVELVDFAAQWFEVYFFELPGHGESTAFQQPFTTALVATLVEQLADALGLSRFNLMGFSFGGILTMQAYMRLRHRIDRVVLIAPCLTWRAIQLSNVRRFFIQKLVSFLKLPWVRNGLYRLMHDQPFNPFTAALIQRLGNIEHTIPLKDVFQQLKPVTLEILISQIDETLQIEFLRPPELFESQCYFAMSIYDPLLSYSTTVDTLREFFADPAITQLYYPFHQAPRPFTFEELNGDFHEAVESFMKVSQEILQPV